MTRSIISGGAYGLVIQGDAEVALDKTVVIDSDRAYAGSIGLPVAPPPPIVGL